MTHSQPPLAFEQNRDHQDSVLRSRQFRTCGRGTNENGEGHIKAPNWTPVINLLRLRSTASSVMKLDKQLNRTVKLSVFNIPMVRITRLNESHILMKGAEMIEMADGVKRIDYCLKKVWFGGLTRAADGIDVLKLHFYER